MERKKIWQAVRANSISAWNTYDAFMYNLNTTREKIKELYPEVEDKDISIEISYRECDNLELNFEFKRFETDEEQNRRLNYEESQRKLEKEKMMKEIQSFFKLYPELKETILNN
jgi:hypothetical protein